MGNEETPIKDQVKHLGIERNKNNTPDTENRIQTARKTSYALTGSGMHGQNGISPVIATSLLDMFVISRMFHGIEFLDTRKKDLEQLELYQKKMFKMLQSLPENTATSGVYLLLGKTPIEGQMDRRYISTFHDIATKKHMVEHQKAKRQLLMKDDTSNSWFIKINQICQKYSLPSALDMSQTTKKKITLKTERKNSNDQLLTQQIVRGGADKVIFEVPSSRQIGTWKTTSSLGIDLQNTVPWRSRKRL